MLGKQAEYSKQLRKIEWKNKDPKLEKTLALISWKIFRLEVKEALIRRSINEYSDLAAEVGEEVEAMVRGLE